jgi:hypothetical protein
VSGRRFDALGLVVVLAFLVVVAASGYVVFRYGIQGHPTQRERDRQRIAVLEREVRELTLRVDSLSLRLDEGIGHRRSEGQAGVVGAP